MSKKGSIVKNIFIILSIISIIGLTIVTIINSNNLINNTEEIIKVLIILLISFIFSIYSFKNDKGNFLSILSSILLITYSLFNIGIEYNFIKLDEQGYVKDFTNKSLTEVVKWANSNNIELEQIYETSDLVEEYDIISQNIKEGTLVKEVDKLTVVVSSGPNYDKEIILPSFIGKNVDDVIRYVDENFLTNVNIDFIESTESRDNIIEQDKNGQIRRSDKINMVASIGALEDIGEMDMKDLSNLDLFHATTWLKRYGFKYVLEYEYSDKIEKNNIISQSVEKETKVNPLETEVTLTLSKGPKIKVINLKELSVEEITNWVIENSLKIEFIEEYDESVELGKVINVSVNENDEIEQGTLITVTISKGQLKMESFKTAAEFRDWAEKYGIEYNEEYKFDDKVSSGGIISSSHKEGEVIKNSDTVNIVVSQGKSVTVPNLVGKSKSEITKTCSSLGLKCTFKYGGYSDSVKKDVATSQNKKNGGKVASGTSVVITLSSGEAKRYKVVIQSNWLSPGNPDTTIKTLKKNLESACPGVTFKFVKKTVNTGIGLITKNSPIKGGSNTFIQGKTYTIYVGQA